VADERPLVNPAVVSAAVANVKRFQQPVWRWEESDDAVRAYGAFFGILALGLLPVVQDNRYADLPYFIGLAAMTIYVGAHRGLNSRQRQQISIKEGLLAPVLASGAAAAEASTAAAATAPRLHYCWG
jgi:minor histocompatibility antigen H13